MSLALPETFAFTQSSLQAFVDCPRRFWLTYVARLPWPAEEAAPMDERERLLQWGARFHHLVERLERGLDPARVIQDLDHPLDEWVASYRSHRPRDLPTQYRHVEQVLSVPYRSTQARYRLAARYDLIAAERQGDAARAVIVDWKTSPRPGRRTQLQQRLQTLVYPYVLVEASSVFPWGPVDPEQVSMVYWFTAAPDAPVVFPYSPDLHAAARTRLTHLLDDLLARETEADFPKVPDTPENRRRLCGYCVYRSRCNRGQAAASVDELEDVEDLAPVDLEASLEFTLEDVEEIAF